MDYQQAEAKQRELVKKWEAVTGEVAQGRYGPFNPTDAKVWALIAETFLYLLEEVQR